MLIPLLIRQYGYADFQKNRVCWQGISWCLTQRITPGCKGCQEPPPGIGPHFEKWLENPWRDFLINTIALQLLAVLIAGPLSVVSAVTMAHSFVDPAHPIGFLQAASIIYAESGVAGFFRGASLSALLRQRRAIVETLGRYYDRRRRKRAETERQE